MCEIPLELRIVMIPSSMLLICLALYDLLISGLQTVMNMERGSSWELLITTYTNSNKCVILATDPTLTQSILSLSQPCVQFIVAQSTSFRATDAAVTE